MPAMRLNLAPVRWLALPVALEAKMSLPGCALASAMKSLTDLTPSEGAATSTFVLNPIWLTPAKSLIGS